MCCAHLHSLAVVDVDLADLADDEVPRLGLHVVDLVLVPVVEVHLDLVDLVVPGPGVGGLQVLVLPLVRRLVLPGVHLVVLARVDLVVLPCDN